MDPQEKWLSARRRLWRMRGREQREGYWFFKEHPSSLPPSLPLSMGATLEGGRVALAPVWINIISVINIKSALLCFASGSAPRQLEGRVLTDGRFLPSSPPRPRWPFTGTIIYFGEFLGYCFVRANQGWVTNDPGGVVVAWPQPPPPSRSISDTRGQIHFWKFRINCFRPWLREERRKKEGWRRNKEQQWEWWWWWWGGAARTSGCQG